MFQKSKSERKREKSIIVKLMAEQKLIFKQKTIFTEYTNMWRELRKAYPKEEKPLPTGVKDIKGKWITNPRDKKSYMNTSNI